MLKWSFKSGNLCLMRWQYDLIRYLIPFLEHSHLVFGPTSANCQQTDGFQVHLMDNTDSKGDRWSFLVPPSSHIWCLGKQALGQNLLWSKDCVWSMKLPRQSNVVQKKANAKSTIRKKNSNISLNLGNPILKNIQKDIYLPRIYCKHFHWFVHVSMSLSKVCFSCSIKDTFCATQKHSLQS